MNQKKVCVCGTCFWYKPFSYIARHISEMRACEEQSLSGDIYATTDFQESSQIIPHHYQKTTFSSKIERQI